MLMLQVQGRALAAAASLPRRCSSAFRTCAATRGPMATSRAELHAEPGVAPSRDPATKDFFFQQTMLRIKDPKASLDFYTRVLGFTLLTKFDFPEGKFTLFFLGHYPAEEVPDDPKERAAWVIGKPATLELTHNWGTETDPAFQYHSGNSDPRGFGHIGIVVPDVDEACKRFEELGVTFKKRPTDGTMKHIAFILDPDGYWIEILSVSGIRSSIK